MAANAIAVQAMPRTTAVNSGTTPQCTSTCPATESRQRAAAPTNRERIEQAQRDGEFRDDVGPKEIGIFVNLVLNGLALMRAGGEEPPSTDLVLTLLRDAIGPDRARTPARRSA